MSTPDLAHCVKVKVKACRDPSSLVGFLFDVKVVAMAMRRESEEILEGGA